MSDAQGKPMTIDEGLATLAARPQCAMVSNGVRCWNRVHDERMACVFSDRAADHDRMLALVREDDEARAADPTGSIPMFAPGSLAGASVALPDDYFDDAATVPGATLHVFTNDCEWVIAFDKDDARKVWEEHAGRHDVDDMLWEQCPDGALFTFTDEGVEPDQRTFAEWVIAKGRGFLATEID